jgi:hypothetical protein
MIKSRNRRIHINIIKDLYDKPIDSIILKGKKLKPFPLKSEMRQGCPLSLLLFNLVLKFLAKALRTREKNKRDMNRKKKKKSSYPYLQIMILHLKNPEDSTLRYDKHFCQSSRI